MRSIREIREGYLSGKSTPTAEVSRALGEARSNPLNAFLAVAGEDALVFAASAEKEIQNQGSRAFEKRPLLGIPFAVKDNFVTSDLPTTCGSKILEGYLPPYDAQAVALLREAGAILVGKTNLDEFGMGSSGENSAYGATQHPTLPGHVPGGSSAGSAAAVRAGVVPFALGTDTGGSIRLPASFCGAVGFKPTYGRVSRRGMVAYGSSLDQGGPIATNVDDVMEVMKVIDRFDDRDPTSSAIERGKPAQGGRKVGVPAQFFGDGLTAEVRAQMEKTIDRLKAKGFTLVNIDLPSLPYAISVYYLIAMSEASSNLSRFDGARFGQRVPKAISARSIGEFYEENRSLFGAEVKRRILLGSFALSAGYSSAYFEKACKVRRLIADEMNRALSKVDFLIGPVAPIPPFKMGEKTSDPMQMYLTDILTVPVNLVGLPAISIPVRGHRDGETPIGFQIIGRGHGDEDVMHFANEVMA